VVRAKIGLALATAVAAGDEIRAVATRVRDRALPCCFKDGTRIVLAVVQAAYGLPGGVADDVVPGATDIAGTIRKALAGTARVTAEVHAFVARLSRRAPRGYSQESRPKQRPPGGTPGSRRREEVSQAIKSLVIHRVDPP
jgi:hypothetical protein